VTPWDGPATTIHVLDESVPGRRLAIGRLEAGFLVLDDLARGERLGPVDLISMFAIDVNGQENIVIAGSDESAARVTLEWDPESMEVRRVENGVWLSSPRLFVPGATVTVHWDHGDGELRFTTCGPLHGEDLIPRGQPWTGYASR
jgi:hypothetical protein